VAVAKPLVDMSTGLLMSIMKVKRVSCLTEHL